MQAEHLNAMDSDIEFTVGNYGVSTLSKLEWHFVVTDCPRLGGRRWI